MDLIKIAEEAFATKKELPSFKSGDTITVAYRIKEGNKERIQQYRGVVIRISGHGDKKPDGGDDGQMAVSRTAFQQLQQAEYGRDEQRDNACVHTAQCENMCEARGSERLFDVIAEHRVVAEHDG